MLAMRRENDQIFGSTNSNAINNNTISAPNDAVTDNCCSSNSYQDGELVFFSSIFSHLLQHEYVEEKDFYLFKKAVKLQQIFHQITDSRLNSTTNPSGLEEYVDILQVQQLLLDSTPTSLATSTTTTSNSCLSNSTVNSCGTQRYRPRVNIQKAAEYSTTMANSIGVSTPSAQLQGMLKTQLIKQLIKKNIERKNTFQCENIGTIKSE